MLLAWLSSSADDSPHMHDDCICWQRRTGAEQERADGPRRTIGRRLPARFPARSSRLSSARSPCISTGRGRCCRSCTRSRTRSASSRPQAVPRIAQALNLSRAEVHGVVSFYHDFRTHPARPARAAPVPRRGVPVDGRRAPGASWRSGSWASTSAQTTADGAVTLEAVYCLGNCACSPAAMLDGRGARPARTRPAFARCCAAPERVEVTHDGLRPARHARPSRSAPSASRRRSRAGPAPRRGRARSSATARAGCSGSSRWSRWRRRPAASPTARSRPKTSRRCSTPASWRAARIGCARARPTTSPTCKRQERLTFARVGVTDPLSVEDYDAHGGFARAAHRAGDDRRADRRSRSPTRACAVAAAPPFPTGIKWKHGARRGGHTRSTSSATPTRATRAPSPTACSWRAIPSC